jgi:hypothetical protein
MILSSQSDFLAMLRFYLMARKYNAHLDGWMIFDLYNRNFLSFFVANLGLNNF